MAAPRFPHHGVAWRAAGSDATVQALGKLAYRTARKAAVKQAQQRSMVNVAKGQAKKNVRSLFEIPLRIAGHPDVKVVAIFD